MNFLTRRIKRMNASALLAIVSIGFIVPIAYLMFYSIVGYNGYIEFADKEKSGAIFLKKLKPVLINVSDHCYNLKNGTDNDQTVSTVNSSFEELIKTTSELNESLGISKDQFQKMDKNDIHPTTLYEKWKNGLGSGDKMKLCENLIADLIALNNYVGDISNLILDPDLDSYYLMDVALLAMPQLTNRVYDLKNYIKTNIHDQTLSYENRIYLSVFQSAFRDGDLVRVNGSLQTALEQDASFYGVCPNMAENINNILPDFNQSAENLLKQNSNSSTLDGYINLNKIEEEADNTLQSTFLLWDSSLDELIKLLDIRMDDYRAGRLNTIIIAILFVVIAYLMLFYVSKRISKIIKNTTMFMLSISEGDLSEAAKKVENFKDELYS